MHYQVINMQREETMYQRTTQSSTKKERDDYWTAQYKSRACTTGA